MHCIIECTSEEQLAHGILYLFDSVIGGSLGAAMFMFALGFGMVYTKRRTPGDYARRRIRIGITGYVLNICRFLIPFLGYLIGTEDLAAAHFRSATKRNKLSQAANKHQEAIEQETKKRNHKLGMKALAGLSILALIP